MRNIFKIRNTDKRKKLVDKSLTLTQKPHGADVEYYSDNTGFCLLEKNALVKYDASFTQRAISAAKLSLGARRELREFYYALRTTPELVKAFAGVKPDALYSQILRAIMDAEILCDINRDIFTVGNLSKGFIFYYHSPVFGQKERKIAFTENISRTIMKPEKEEEWQCNNCQNIIVVEKNSAATRLVELELSELTNSIIVTVGGNFNRAIWELASRFKDSKNLIFLADADAYGVDMLRTIRAGTESSRHLDYKFPPSENPKIYLAGLYPSIGELLELANDTEQKRPLQNPFVRQRINFLVKHGLLNQMDYDTWKRDKTYELESLSEGFVNAEGEPIGLGIYLTEYMRLFNIPVKSPLPPDEELKKDFDNAAREELKREIDEKIAYPKFFWDYYNWLTNLKENIKKDIYEKLSSDYEQALEKIGAKEIKYHIWKQFEADPKRANYDLAAIAHKIKAKFNINIDWQLDEFEDALQEAQDNYDGAESNIDANFIPIHNETNYNPNSYDLIEQKLGANPEDVLRVREALLKRFADDPRLKESLD